MPDCTKCDGTGWDDSLIGICQRCDGSGETRLSEDEDDLDFETLADIALDEAQDREGWS